MKSSAQSGLTPVESYKQPTCLEDFGIHNRALMVVLRDYYGEKDFGVKIPYFVELGAGVHAKELPERLCIDIAETEGVDIVYDLNYGIPLPDNCVRQIHSNQVLEHIHNIVFLFNEMWRVMLTGATCWHAVPYYLGPHSWSDPQHVRAFTELSFRYFCVDASGKPFVENFADYGIECQFELVDQKIVGGNQGLEVTLRKP